MDLRVSALRLWLARLELRSILTHQDRTDILALPGRQVEFGSNRDIVKLGERTRHSCLIADGIAARFGQTAEGLRQLSALYLPGDMGDLHSAVLPIVSAPLQSALKATIIFIPHDALHAVAQRSPNLAQAFWRDCVVDAQIASEWMLSLGRRNASGRLAHLLCELACRYAAAGAPGRQFPLLLTQLQLGDATGLTSVHVNRTLRYLRERGTIDIRDRQVAILDWDKLVKIGEFDPGYLHLARE